MEKFSEDLFLLLEKCKSIKKSYSTPKIKSVIDGLENAIYTVSKSWSGSWLGYHAYVYYKDFNTPPESHYFSSEWGLYDDGYDFGIVQKTKGPWIKYTYEDVYNFILKESGNPDIDGFDEFCEDMKNKCNEIKDELLITIDVIISTQNNDFLQKLKKDVEKIKIFSQQDFINQFLPKGKLMSRDSLAVTEGIKVPPHKAIEAQLYSQIHPKVVADELLSHIKKLISYFNKKEKFMSFSKSKKIFIGHGHSLVWRDLKDFLSERLNLEWDEFNREPIAGMTILERLSQMLDNSSFAFIIMTAEDEHSDKTLHARENVIHEVGLFQGRLGFRKSIILLEEGCKEFSNIHGLIQIRFPKNNIRSIFEEIRRVLEREGILSQ